MTDVFDAAKRSHVMSRIRGHGNATTELRLMALLRANRINGWRRGMTITGRPDFVWKRERVAVFVDGCFWHGCPKHARIPKSSREFWDAKRKRNKSRDLKVNRILRRQGWCIVRIWECNLRPANQAMTLSRLHRMLKRSSRKVEARDAGPELQRGPPLHA